MRTIVVLAVAVALASAGCRKKDPEAAAKVDAGPADAAAVVVADVPFSVVAEGPMDISLEKTSDGRLLVVSGTTLFEAKPDGALEPVLAPAELAKLIPDDETMTGYSTVRTIRSVNGSLAGTLVMEVWGEMPEAEIYTHSAGKLTRVYEPPREADLDSRRYLSEVFVFRGHPIAIDGRSGGLAWVERSDAPPPSPPSGLMLHGWRAMSGPDGSVVMYETGTSSKALLVLRDGADRVEELRFPNDETGCSFMPSFGKKIAINCGTTAYTFEGDKFVKSYSRSEPFLTAQTAQDAGGALYIASDAKVTRCLAEGPCTTRELPSPPPVRIATYELSPTEFARAESSDPWRRLYVDDPGSYTTVDGVHGIFARAQNDVWVIVRRGARKQLLHTSPPPARPKMLPTSADARVALRNRRPPATWTSSCDQVYVRLGADAEAIKKRAPEIRKAVGAAEEAYLDPIPWALVEGELDGDRSVGVILTRQDPLQKISVLETATKKLVKAFTTGPANEPAVFCSMPVLERKLLPEMP